MRIAQLVPALHPGDAIGNDARTLSAYFQRNGISSAVFYLHADPEVAAEGFPVSSYPEWIGDDAANVTILHYALPSPLNDRFARTAGRRILVYHNITPSEFLQGYPHLQHLSREGRRALAELRTIPCTAVADSEYNRLELAAMGFADTRVIPIFIDFDRLNESPCPVTLRMHRVEQMVTFLFVGRVTPNKCQHDVIRLYGVYKRAVNPRCRLFLVGKYDGFEPYLDRCRRAADRFRLGDVHFVGRVTHRELLAYYHMADLFVSMSEHEGFGVPLVEAMHRGVPVMAYAAAAVPYTMGDAGIRFRQKSGMWLELAHLAHLAATDPVVRTRILAGQTLRLEAFSMAHVARLWDAVLGASDLR
ncbi:glycosyltransferase family 4 protein [bacterium]|nr:glycosyltransferase family 4 protein [candidate division CSSED10-310 bacterium]